MILTEGARPHLPPRHLPYCKELIDEEELLLVRNYMIGSILGDLDGPFHIINRWKTIVLNNLDESYFYNQINTIKTEVLKNCSNWPINI